MMPASKFYLGVSVCVYVFLRLAQCVCPAVLISVCPRVCVNLTFLSECVCVCLSVFLSKSEMSQWLCVESFCVIFFLDLCAKLSLPAFVCMAEWLCPDLLIWVCPRLSV